MLAASAVALVMLASPTNLDTARIEKLTGAQGVASSDGAFRVSLPRSDLDVYASDVKVTAPMGLTAWAAFKKLDKGTLVVGELVLLEDQVQAAESAVIAGGLEVNGLDRHFIGESPRLVFMHFSAVGDEAALSSAVGRALDAVRSKSASAMPRLAELDSGHKPLDAKKLEAVLGNGKVVDDVFVIVRPRPVKLHGASVGAEMGAASWAAITGSDDAAAVSGGFAAQETELQAVFKAANAGGLSITSIDAPFYGDAPHLRMVHFWGKGAADKLALAVKAGFAQVK